MAQIRRFYMVTVQYDTNDMMFFFKPINFDYEVRAVAFNYGEEGTRMDVEMILHDMEVDCIIYDLGVISDHRCSREEIIDKMVGWLTEITNSDGSEQEQIDSEQEQEQIGSEQISSNQEQEQEQEQEQILNVPNQEQEQEQIDPAFLSKGG